MAEETNNELVPVPEYEVLEKVDDQAIIQMMTGQAIKDYVYSFKQGGKVVEGLTLAGINEAANRRGGIEVDTIEYTEREQSWLAIVKATDSITGSSRYGACEQPKNAGSRPDTFAFTKAIHKAQRNAIKQLLPVPVLKEVLNYYLHGKSSGTTYQVLESNATQNDNVTNAQKAAFSLASKLKPRFDQNAISQNDFWNYVKRRYGVETRNDMTEMHWTQLSAELTAADRTPELFNEMLDRIKKLEAAAAASEIPETPDPDLDTEPESSDVPTSTPF